MPEPQIGDFDDMESLLSAAGVDWEAAEAHGAFCGMACLRGSAAILEWLQLMLAQTDINDVLVQERAAALKEQAAHTILSLEAGDMGIDLLLPGDDRRLAERTAGLADWCHGFMHGLVTAGGADQGLKADALDASIPAEILDDFSQITRAGVEESDSDSESEESEQAYAELVEYVRVSVQLVYDETAGLRQSGFDQTKN